MSWTLHVDAEAGMTPVAVPVETAGGHLARTMREEVGERSVVWKSSQSNVSTRDMRAWS